MGGCAKPYPGVLANMQSEHAIKHHARDNKHSSRGSFPGRGNYTSRLIAQQTTSFVVPHGMHAWCCLRGSCHISLRCILGVTCCCW